MHRHFQTTSSTYMHGYHPRLLTRYSTSGQQPAPPGKPRSSAQTPRAQSGLTARGTRPRRWKGCRPEFPSSTIAVCILLRCHRWTTVSSNGMARVWGLERGEADVRERAPNSLDFMLLDLAARWNRNMQIGRTFPPAKYSPPAALRAFSRLPIHLVSTKHDTKHVRTWSKPWTSCETDR